MQVSCGLIVFLSLVGVSQAQASGPDYTARAIVQLLGIGPGANGNDRKCSGTGFLVNEDGVILTNAHVVHDAERCMGRPGNSHASGLLAKLPNESGNAAPAVSCDVIGFDEEHDLAILKPEHSLSSSTPGNSSPFLSLDVEGAHAIPEGAPIWVTGHPRFAWRPVGQSGTLIRRDRLRLSGAQGEPVDVLILNISLQPGSSGSPVFLPGEGTVIGVVEGQRSRRPSETIAITIRYGVDLLDRYSLRWHPPVK